MKKIILAALVMLSSVAANAQIVSSTSKSRISTKSEKKVEFVTGLGFGVVASGAGASVDFDMHWQKNIYKDCLAWDIIALDWAAPFDSPADYDEVSVRTGVRAFTPTFYKNMRGYVNLDLGYTCVLAKGYGFASSGHDYDDYDFDMDDYYDLLHYYGYAPESRASSSSSSIDANHAFGLEFGAGIELTKKLALGYSLHYNTFTESTGHFAKISVKF